MGAEVGEPQSGAAPKILDHTAVTLTASTSGTAENRQLQRKFSISNSRARDVVRHMFGRVAVSLPHTTFCVVAFAALLIATIAIRRRRAGFRVVQLLNGTDETMDTLIGTAD